MADTPTTADSGTLETRADAGRRPADVAAMWLDAIDLQSRDEEAWRKRAVRVNDVYRAQKARASGEMDAYRSTRFAILYANTQILQPAIYNSEPVPDIRERWQDGDPLARDAARLVERCLSYTIEESGLSDAFTACAQDVLLAGRGVPRLIWTPPNAEGKGEEIKVKHVQWDDFRRGPAKSWDDVPWVAFKHMMTREELIELNPTIGAKMEMDCMVAGADKTARTSDGEAVPDIFKRGTVWQIWDKVERKVLYVAPASKEGPLREIDDPYGLRGFFPVPRPVLAQFSSSSLVPVEPYRQYSAQADEMDALTRRMSAITKGLKWRGAYLSPVGGEFLDAFKNLMDGEMAPIQNPAAMMGDKISSLGDAFWWMDIDKPAQVLAALQVQREQVKQTIYEVTGISDILRGATNPNETLGAQELKANNGSLRISDMQGEMARMARDVIRMMSEIICTNFQPETMMAMAAMPNVNPKVFDLLRDDVLRRFKIEVETDSTIRADLMRQQRNIGQFVQGLGAFIAAVAPAVQAGFPIQLVAEMLASFARPFRLGRKVEEMLDQLPQMMQQAAPQPGAPGSPEANADAGKMDVEKQKLDMDMQKHRMTLDQQMQMKRMELQAANPDMAGMEQLMGAVGQALQTLLQAQQMGAQQAMQSAQALDRTATVIEQAAAQVAAPKMLQRDEMGNMAAMMPAMGMQ